MTAWQFLPIATVHSSSLNRDNEHIPAADATAWALLSLLLFCLICFAIGAVVIARQKKLVDKSAEAADKEETTITQTSSTPKKEHPPKKSDPWERDPDWWKKL